MPKTGFPAPTVESTAEEILEYIRYKQRKITKLRDQSRKICEHVERAKKILDIIVERNGK